MIETWLENHFARRLRPDKLIEYLQGKSLSAPKESWERTASKIRVSCVQRKIVPVRKGSEFVDLLQPFVHQAAVRGSQLVVFPEYNFFDLFGLIPGFSLVNQFLTTQARKERSHPPKSDPVNSREPQYLYSLFSSIAEPSRQAILTIMAQLAQIYQIYIHTGSYLLKEGDHLYNAVSLVDPAGKVIATQKKIHLTDFEAKLGIARCTRLKVYELAIGKVAIPVCMDATYFETFQMARNLGADLVIIPIANNEEYNLWKSLRGIWPRVQESYVFGLKSSLNGWLGGMHFTGKAGIFAPLEITDNQDGILALADHYEGDQLITGELDYQKLYRAREQAEYHGDQNLDFEERFVNTLMRR